MDRREAKRILEREKENEQRARQGLPPVETEGEGNELPPEILALLKAYQDKEAEPGPASPILDKTPVLLQELRPDDEACGSFVNSSVAYIKRSQVKDGRQVVSLMGIPITTANLGDVIDDLTGGAGKPRPPVKTTVFGPDSQIGQQLGCERPIPVDVFDLTDVDYQKALESYNAQYLWQMAAAAINIPVYWKPSPSSEPVQARTVQEKADGLRQMGITPAQARTIADAAMELFKLTKEETRAFFGAGSA